MTPNALNTHANRGINPWLWCRWPLDEARIAPILRDGARAHHAWRLFRCSLSATPLARSTRRSMSQPDTQL